MAAEEHSSQSYRMTTAGDRDAPEDDFFDKEAAFDAWHDHSGSRGSSVFRKFGILIALLVLALIFIYFFYSALRPKNEPVRLSQATILDSRIDEIELRLTRIEEKGLEIVQPSDSDEQLELIERLSDRIDRLENSLKTMMDQAAAEKKAKNEEPPAPKLSAKKPVQKEKTAPEVAPKIEKAATPPPAGSRFHIVLPEENLYRIGLRYGLTVEQLKDFNNLTNNTIRVGQKLRVSP